MPLLTIGNAELHFDIQGQGDAVLALAPGGMLSHRELWRVTRDGRPREYPDPVAALASRYRVIAPDQRNAGRSRAPVLASDGWTTYARDHLGLLDALGVQRFHVIGSCIGSSFALKLCELAPERVVSTILQQPIGIAGQEGKRGESFDQWADSVRQRDPAIDERALEGLRHNLFGGDFVFSVSRDFVRRNPIPLLILGGNDPLHPRAVSLELAQLAPAATLVEEWKTQPRRYLDAIQDFLARHPA